LTSLDPIWTLKTDALFLLNVSVKDLFVGEGLVCYLYDFDKLGKNERLACVTIPPKQLYEAKGERMVFKLGPCPGKTTDVPGYMAFRFRRASDSDISFMTEYINRDKASFLGGKKPAVETAEGVTGRGNLKSLISKRSRIGKVGKNAGTREVRLMDPASDICVVQSRYILTPQASLSSTKFVLDQTPLVWTRLLG
jgi:hypothetical protein